MHLKKKHPKSFLCLLWVLGLLYPSPPPRLTVGPLLHNFPCWSTAPQPGMQLRNHFQHGLCFPCHPWAHCASTQHWLQQGAFSTSGDSSLCVRISPALPALGAQHSLWHLADTGPSPHRPLQGLASRLWQGCVRTIRAQCSGSPAGPSVSKMPQGVPLLLQPLSHPHLAR